MKLPDGWKYIKLSELFDEVSEKNHSDAEVLTIVQGVGTVPRKDSGRDIIYDKNSLSNYKYVQKDDFIIHLRSFEGGLESANQEGIVSPAYIILHLKIQAEPGYLYALFHSNRFINQTMAPAVEGVRDGRTVKYEVLKNQSIPFPPLAEQQKIAEILCRQDKIISLKQKLLEQKLQQKKWLMHKLLEVPHSNTNCEEKFSLEGVVIDTSGWKKVRLESIFFEINERNHPNESVLTIVQGYGTDYRSNVDRRINYDKANVTSYKAVQKGDFIIHLRSFEGGLEMANQNGIVSPAYIILRLKKNLFNKFLYFLFHSHEFIYRTIAKSVEGIRDGRSVKYESLKKQEIYLPPLHEQKIIAQVLSTADKEIALLKSSIEQEKQKKKSLAQLLLIGTVRVKI